MKILLRSTIMVCLALGGVWIYSIWFPVFTTNWMLCDGIFAYGYNDYVSPWGQRGTVIWLPLLCIGWVTYLTWQGRQPELAKAMNRRLSLLGLVFAAAALITWLITAKVCITLRVSQSPDYAYWITKGDVSLYSYNPDVPAGLDFFVRDSWQFSPNRWLPSAGQGVFGVEFAHVPLWLLAALFGVPSAIHWKASKTKKGHCEQCGYCLTGNKTGRCPECGTSCDAKHPGSDCVRLKHRES